MSDKSLSRAVSTVVTVEDAVALAGVDDDEDDGAVVCDFDEPPHPTMTAARQRAGTTRRRFMAASVPRRG